MAGLALLFFAGLDRGLWTPDEPREAGMGREMLEHPGFVPLLNGKPFYEKPPLYYWALAGAFRLTGGPSAAAARSVSVLSCLLILAVTFRGLRRAAGAGPASAAVLILATSLGFFRASQWILLDPVLALWTTLAFWGAFECLSGGSAAAWLLMVAGLSLAFWTKGLIGLALFAPGWAVFAWQYRREGLLPRLRPFASAAVVVAAIAACLAGFYVADGRAGLYQFLWVNHVERFLHPVATGHAEPWSYYLSALPVALLPWSLLLPALFAPRFWRSGDSARTRLLRPFLGWTVAGGFLLLSAASTKRETYLLPLLPLLASLLGLAMDDVIRSEGAAGRFLSPLIRYVHPWAPAAWAFLPPLAAWIYTGTLGAAGAALLAVGALLAAAGLLAAFRAGPSKAFPWQAASAFAGCAAVLLLVVPPLDRVKNLEPFVERIGRVVPDGAPLAALSADETLYGIIPFVTGRDVAGLTEDEFVARVLSGRRPAFVVEQADPEHRFPRDPAILGYEVVMEDEFGPARALRLWRDACGCPRGTAETRTPAGRPSARRG